MLMLMLRIPIRRRMHERSVFLSLPDEEPSRNSIERRGSPADYHDGPP